MASPKSRLNEFLQKYCGRPVTKQDVIYTVSRYSGSQFQCVVKLPCMDGAEYAGEVCPDAKAAENSAADQVLIGNQDVVDATMQGKRKASSSLSPAEKRAKAEENGQDPDSNPAITPKTQLNSLVMRIIKRFLQKGETLYETKKVEGVSGLYQSTVTLSALPGEWGERAWAGHVCPTKQKAEQSAAEEALKDLQNDPEMQEEAKKGKGGGGKGKGGKGKGKFGMGGGWDMGFFDHVMLGAYGWSPMSKGKGKSFGYGAPAETRVPGRDRVTDAPCVGTVVEWQGQHGWLEAALPIDHPMANSRGGKIFVHQRDLPEGVESLLEGQPLSFHVYSDSSGLGAEEVVIA